MAMISRRSVAALVVVGVLSVGACGDDDDTAITADTTTTSEATTSSSTTAPEATTTTRSPTSTTTAGSAAPGPVTFVVAGPSGGSGEIELSWEGVANATGYRVLRATTTSGPFSVSADLDLSTGATTMGDGVTNVWSPPADFPPFTTTPGVEPPPHFQYIEVVSGGVERRYFQVVAYNAGGEGAPSVTVCGAPTGEPQC